ncbi:hypothetical protein FQR65_LT02240 [Abscondita terminalis]|nr:hypothetical protein FQR65_LT02240 [Abscondita terminalis]
MSLSTILNLYACDIFSENELVEVFMDICDRVVFHGELVALEDQQIFDKFLNHICAIQCGATQGPATTNLGEIETPSTSNIGATLSLSTTNISATPSSSTANFGENKSPSTANFGATQGPSSFNISATPSSSTTNFGENETLSTTNFAANQVPSTFNIFATPSSSTTNFGATQVPSNFNIFATPTSSATNFGANQGLSTSNIIGAAIDVSNLKHFTLIGKGEKKFTEFNAMGEVILCEFKHVGPITNPFTWSTQTFNKILDHLLAGFRPSHLVGQQSGITMKWYIWIEEFYQKPIDPTGYLQNSRLKHGIFVDGSFHFLISTSTN